MTIEDEAEIRLELDKLNLREELEAVLQGSEVDRIRFLERLKDAATTKEQVDFLLGVLRGW